MEEVIEDVGSPVLSTENTRGLENQRKLNPRKEIKLIFSVSTSFSFDLQAVYVDYLKPALVRLDKICLDVRVFLKIEGMSFFIINCC